MISKIVIHDLHAPATIGVNDHEKLAPQDLFFTITLTVSVVRSFVTDAIHDTVDYDCLSQELVAFVASSRFELLEALAFQCIHKLFDFSMAIHAVELTIQKPHALPSARAVAFYLAMNRSD